jgi:hypothetical protein
MQGLQPAPAADRVLLLPVLCNYVDHFVLSGLVNKAASLLVQYCVFELPNPST